MKRPTVQSMLVALVVGAGCGFSPWMLRAQDSAEFQSVPLTYEAIEQTTSMSSGATLGERRIVYARRADGSDARIVQSRANDGELMEQRRIRNLESGRVLAVSPSERAVTTFHYSENALRNVRSERYSTCDDGQSGLSEETVLGFEVVLNVVEVPGVNGARIENYHAPSLGCLPLRSTTHKYFADGEDILISMQVTNIELGEPDAALFAVPDEYSEMSPMRYGESVLSRKGKDVNAIYGDQKFLSLEQSYQEGR